MAPSISASLHQQEVTCSSRTVAGQGGFQFRQVFFGSRGGGECFAFDVGKDHSYFGKFSFTS
ncbi:putative neogenin-like [Sesbania bispinosa]|nr:putative neogenin-like [Sesbania bispinosa]